MAILTKDQTGTDRDSLFFRFASGLYFIVMMALLCVWWKNTPDSPPVYRISGLFSVLLFSLSVLLFLRKWSADWFLSSPQTQSDPCCDTIRFPAVLRLFAVLLFVDVSIVLLVWFLQWKLLGKTDFRSSLVLWSQTDSFHYLNIAKDWYLSEGSRDRLVELVFLPGYPVAVRILSSILRNPLYAGMVVSALSFAGGGTLLYCLARLDMDHRSALRVVRYAVLLPASFFYAAPQSESLFLLLSISCVYLARKQHWLPACILGGLASFTRSLGILLLIPVGFEMIQSFRLRNERVYSPSHRILTFLMLLLILSGFAVYCLICWNASGNPLQWMIYQRENWYQQMGLFFDTAAFQAEQLVRCFQNQEYDLMVGIRLPNLLASFAALLIMALSFRRMRPGYAAYFISYYVIAFGATNLISGPRYLLVLFPYVFGIAEITRKRAIDIIVTILTAVLSLIYLLLFIYQCYIW